MTAKPAQPQESALAWGPPERRVSMSGSGDSAAPATLEGRKALVVEDSWHIAVAMKCLLENAGLVVIGPAARADPALKLIDAQQVDVAVIDINLNGTPAYDLVDRLRERGIPVIVVSGYERVEELDGKIEAFLTKPVRSRALLASLQSVFARLAGTA